MCRGRHGASRYHPQQRNHDGNATHRNNEAFDAPVQRVFRFFSEHEKLKSPFAPAKIRRISDVDLERNGVGSARQMQVRGAPPFVETVTAYQANQLTEYRITEGSPVAGPPRRDEVSRGRRRSHAVSLRHHVRRQGAAHRVVIWHFLEGGIRRGARKLRLSNPW